MLPGGREVILSIAFCLASRPDSRGDLACRWRNKTPEDGEWVAAKRVIDAATAECEVAALNLASKFDVPRVVQLKEVLRHPCTGRVLVLE